MTEPVLILCPNCNNQEFEAHSISKLFLVHAEGAELAARLSEWKSEPDFLRESSIRKLYTCYQCGYAIGDKDDLKMTTIDVYIVGDSISGRRHGLAKVSRGLDAKWDIAAMGMLLASDGYFGFGDKDGRPASWVFTKSAWKRAEADHEFRLTEGQYAVNLKDLT